MTALALVSGGLDSVLAAKLMLEQGIEVLGASFEAPFFNADSARESCDELGIELVVIDIGPDLLDVIAAPKHGFGRFVNPCIDCHALMVRKASDRMGELGASFIVTGEVVGQRPKSQMRFGLDAVERESGLKGLLLRPLSAKLLAATTPETEGWVDRERLLGLHGRTRKPQMELAARFGITKFASPAGGCLLTDENYARVFRDLRDHEQLSLDSVRLLSVGRQFRLSDRAKLVVGRNHSENELLFQLKPESAVFLKTVDHKGPVAVLSGDPNEADVETAARLVSRYSDSPAGETTRVQVWSEGGGSREVEVVPLAPREARGFAV
ncbi:MAG: tRNA 4-thiouridine(8) synthase ThiI [Candidatus Eisenbacteria bacterium]